MITNLQTQHPDRYGYYAIGTDRKTYSKIELIESQYRMPSAWHWHYNDEFFGCFDWQQEPSADLNELYRRRAQELRDSYDYLVLTYSGGHDSSNVLHSFLDNGIPIDEVLVYTSGHNEATEMNFEVRNYTLPKLERLRELNHDIRLRFVDFHDFYYEWDRPLVQAGYGANLLDMCGGMLTINRFAIDLMHQLVPEYQRIIDSGRKLAWISGCEKPMLRYVNGRWVFNFHDTMIQARVTPFRQLIDQGDIGISEFFYWSPTPAAANIIIKQCHAIRNHFGAQARADFSQIPEAKAYNEGYGWELDRISDQFLRLIYPHNFLRTESYVLYTGVNHIFGNGQRDGWFWSTNHDRNHLHRDMWQALAGPRFSHYHSWYNDGCSVVSGIKNCISRDYVIGD